MASLSALGSLSRHCFVGNLRKTSHISERANTGRLIPIVSIITPTTLSVELRDNIPHNTVQHIPRVDFSNLNFMEGMPYEWAQSANPDGSQPSYSFYTYNGPSQIVKQISMAVGAQNTILPIETPYPNSSWTLEFVGPSIKCAPLPWSDRQIFQRNIVQYYLQKKNCLTPPTFLAWFPRPWNNITVPYPPMRNNKTTLLPFDPIEVWTYGTSFASGYDEPAHLPNGSSM